MRGFFSTVVLAWLAPLAAWAQAPETAPTKDKEAITFQEIERGLHFAVGAGYFAFTNAPANPGANSPYSGGEMARMEVGYDFGERISLALFVMATSNKAGS